MKEYSESFNLPSVILCRKDLIDLESLLKKDITLRENDLMVSITKGHNHISENSIQNLLLHDLPDFVDKMTIAINLFKKEEIKIEFSLRLTMYHNYISCYISSASESLFFGKKEQVRQFFLRHRTWSGVMNRLSCLFMPVINGALLPATFLLFGREFYILGFLCICLFFFNSITLFLVWTNRLFPYVRVYLRDKRSWSQKYAVITLIINLFLLIATIISIILQILKS